MDQTMLPYSYAETTLPPSYYDSGTQLNTADGAATNSPDQGPPSESPKGSRSVAFDERVDYRKRSSTVDEEPSNSNFDSTNMSGSEDPTDEHEDQTAVSDRSTQEERVAEEQDGYLRASSSVTGTQLTSTSPNSPH
ncbi:uncharacterized protein LOC134841139 [Symsagittifera roscoffensis]|uniref:uncharacterized protein LOC134841139 n=1 Tax=Symsagittifera roscoffensis TaxID=84072 RepID=UPI00307B4549